MLLFPRDVISVFSKGEGQNFDRLPRGGGAKYEEKHMLCKNTRKSLFFLFREGKCPPPCPHK